MTPGPAAGGEDWVCVARLGRTRGLGGELFADGYQTGLERYQTLGEVWLRTPAGEWLADGRAFSLAGVWELKDRLVVRFAGVDSIDAATPLVNCEVCVPRSRLAELPPGEYYLADFLGCRVIDRQDGELLGEVTGWLETGGPPLMEVSRPGRREPLLVPFAASLLARVDLGAKVLEVSLPDGLKELNAG